MLLLILFAGCLATSVAQNITVTGMPTETITVTETPTETITVTETPTEAITVTGAPTETITVTETPTETITVTGAPTETTAVPIAFETATSAVYLPEYVAILQAYVQYAGPYDLNEITAQPILSELSQRIKQELQDSSISLKIRNITKV